MDHANPNPPLSSTAWRVFGLRVFWGALAIAGFSLVTHTWLPYPWGDTRLQAKLDYLLAHAETFDTVFVGSSYTYRQISPRVFDRELARLHGGSASSRSFNLAVDGLHLPATKVLLEHLASEPKIAGNVRHIVFELGRFTSAVDNKIDHSTEAKFWRTPRLTGDMIRFLWFRPDKRLESKALQSLKLMGIQAEAGLHIGQGPDLLRFAGGLERKQPSAHILGPHLDGYYAVDQQALNATGKPISNRFLRNPQAGRVLEQVKERCLRAFEAPLTRVNPEGLRWLDEVRQVAERQNWSLIFVVPPRLEQRYLHLRPLFEHLPEHELVWQLADPRAYDAFYRLDESADRGHLSSKGAIRYSRLLAREVFRLRAMTPQREEGQTTTHE